MAKIKSKYWMGLLGSLAIVGVTMALFTNCQPIAEDTRSSNSDLPSGSGGTPGVTGETGLSRFTNVVSPALTTNCGSCHALPFQGGTAPITIFNYTFMRGLIAQGPTATNNPLYNKMRNRVAHGANSDQCFGDLNGSVSPCKEVVAWSLLEFPLATDGIAGGLGKFDLLGRMQGFAIDPDNLNLAIPVLVYVNGPVGTGQLLSTVTANLQGLGTVENGHYFRFDIPANMRDGVNRNYYFYGISAVAANLLPGSPLAGTAYQQNQAGRDFYNANLAPRLNACTRCHQVTYDVHWFQLGDPTPGLGSATNNLLINMMNGQNGHSGGSFCGGNKNNQPCATVQQWWNLEF